jgi:hypothetical protein
MYIEAERFLAVTAMLAGVVPTRAPLREPDVEAEGDDADVGVDEA